MWESKASHHYPPFPKRRIEQREDSNPKITQGRVGGKNKIWVPASTFPRVDHVLGISKAQKFLSQSIIGMMWFASSVCADVFDEVSRALLTSFAERCLRVICCLIAICSFHACFMPAPAPPFRWMPLTNCLCPLSLFRRHCRMSDPLYLACRPSLHVTQPTFDTGRLRATLTLQLVLVITLVNWASQYGIYFCRFCRLSKFHSQRTMKNIFFEATQSQWTVKNITSTESSQLSTYVPSKILFCFLVPDLLHAFFRKSAYVVQSACFMHSFANTAGRTFSYLRRIALGSVCSWGHTIWILSWTGNYR